MKELAFRTLQVRAITPGDASPDPGGVSWAWSSVINAPVFWDSTNSRWRGIKPIHVGTTAPANPAVGDLWVDTN